MSNDVKVRFRYTTFRAPRPEKVVLYQPPSKVLMLRHAVKEVPTRQKMRCNIAWAVAVWAIFCEAPEHAQIRPARNIHFVTLRGESGVKPTSHETLPRRLYLFPDDAVSVQVDGDNLTVDDLSLNVTRRLHRMTIYT